MGEKKDNGTNWNIKIIEIIKNNHTTLSLKKI